MKIRRVQYDLEFSHILTFQDEYRSKIAPIFKIPKVRYQIDNIGTFDESIKLVFTDFNFVILCNKGAIRMLYEGDPKDFTKGGSPIWDIFTQVLTAIREIPGFGYLTRHTLNVQAVEIKSNNQEPHELESSTIDLSKYIKFTPFAKYKDFAVVFENGDEENVSKITFGNFDKDDIIKFDLSPFETDYNKDLFQGKGYLANVVFKRPINSFSKTSFSKILFEVEDLIKKFL